MCNAHADVIVEVHDQTMDPDLAVLTAYERLEAHVHTESCGCGADALRKAFDFGSVESASSYFTPAVAHCVFRFRQQLERELHASFLHGAEVWLSGDEDALLALEGKARNRLSKALRLRPSEQHLFPLTFDRVKRLWNVLSDNVNAFLWRRMGQRAAKEDIARWKKSGLIPAGADLSDYLGDAYRFARLAEIMDHGSSYSDMLKLAEGSPLSASELMGLDWAKAHAAVNITGLKNAFADQLLNKVRAQGDIVSEFGHIAELSNEADQDSPESGALRQAMADVIQEAKSADMSRRELASELRNQSGDWGRDWDRIAATEFGSIENWGRARDIKDRAISRGESDPWVVVLIRDTACKGCKRLFLNPDGTPRPYRLSELMANGTNAGRAWFNPETGRHVGLQPQRIHWDDKAGTFTAATGGWLPVIPPVHPNCACVLAEYGRFTEWARQDDLGRSSWPVTIREDREASDQLEASIVALVTRMSEDQAMRERFRRQAGG